MESNLDLLQNNVEKHREAVAVPQTTYGTTIVCLLVKL